MIFLPEMKAVGVFDTGCVCHKGLSRFHGRFTVKPVHCPLCPQIVYPPHLDVLWVDTKAHCIKGSVFCVNQFPSRLDLNAKRLPDIAGYFILCLVQVRCVVGYHIDVIHKNKYPLNERLFLSTPYLVATFHMVIQLGKVKLTKGY